MGGGEGGPEGGEGDGGGLEGSGAPRLPDSKSPGLARRRLKTPVPKGAVWWDRGEGHPCLRFFGAELRHQRWDKRGWSLEDLHQAAGLCRSFLCDLENGKAAPTEEVILELEAAMGMDDEGLMRLVRRRWMKAVAKEVAVKGVIAPLARQMRAIRRALRREALGAWLASCLPWAGGIPEWEPVLEG
jgi:transcriptional regulator with XRE-family HTH domain